jgi:mannose-1-phosphate guanylyltransferase/mannose-6-phosphate isomerase
MADRPRIRERPWGRYREYARNEPCTVWVVEMEPGEEGSLQAHQHFDELWILLTEGAVVQVGDTLLRPRALDEIFIARGTKHRLSNRHGTDVVRMMEVAYGEVRDEDKVRYDDRYGRP